MGCDIHIVMERHEPETGEWVGIWSSDNGPWGRTKVAQRDYGFFAQFAVRGRAEQGVIWPRNLPKTVSRLAWLQYMRCPTDYHSASHASVDEFCQAWLAANPNDEKVRREHVAYDLLGLSLDEDDPEHRLVFWFDN